MNNMPGGQSERSDFYTFRPYFSNTAGVLVYCKSLKYSGNNKIAIIALCPYALL